MKISENLKSHLPTFLLLFCLCMNNSTFAEEEEEDTLKPICKSNFSSAPSQKKKLENISLEPFGYSLLEDDNIKRTSHSGYEKEQKKLNKNHNKKTRLAGLFLKSLRDIAVGVAHCSTYNPYNFSGYSR